MAETDAPDDPRTIAEDIVTRATEDRPLAAADRTALVDALTEDLGSAHIMETVVEARLTKMESQTRAISEAVIAIAETAPAVTVAVDALKDKL